MLGGFLTCYATGGTFDQYIIYMLGNTFSVLSVLYLNKIGSDRVRNSAWLSVIMAGLVALLMQTGRAVVAVIMGNSLDIAVGFILGDVLSGVFAMVIVGIARKLDGVFEDQKHYLIRINKEEKELEEGFDEG